MTETELMTGDTKKTFLFINVKKSAYKVVSVTCTDEEIMNGCLDEYDIDPEEEYSILSASSYRGEWKITAIDPGDALEIESGITVTRLA